MELITKNSEEDFVDLLAEIQKNPDPWVSVHINMARISEEMLEKEMLSKQTMDKILQSSMQVAKQIYSSPLNELEGKLFVFEDSDVLALFIKGNDAAYYSELTRLRQEFTMGGLGVIFSIEDMKDKMESLIKLSDEKTKTAISYKLKRKAISVSESIFSDKTPSSIDRETILAIQQKRNLRTKGCILLIEDDVVARGMVAMGLRDKYKIAHAKDAVSGIIQYIDSAPDMVFLDIHLPDHNGKEVLERIKWLDPQCYVVMLSGDSVPENVLSTKSKGAFGFIRKPFSKEKIRAQVEQCPTLKGKGGI